MTAPDEHKLLRWQLARSAGKSPHEASLFAVVANDNIEGWDNSPSYRETLSAVAEAVREGGAALSGGVTRS